MSLLVCGLLIATFYVAQLLNWAAVGYLLARLRSPFPDGTATGAVVPDTTRTMARMRQRGRWIIGLFAGLVLLGTASATALLVVPVVQSHVLLVVQVALGLSLFMTAHSGCCLSSLSVKLLEGFQSHTADGAILFYLKAERVRLLLWLSSWICWSGLFAVLLFVV